MTRTETVHRTAGPNRPSNENAVRKESRRGHFDPEDPNSEAGDSGQFGGDGEPTTTIVVSLPDRFVRRTESSASTAPSVSTTIFLVFIFKLLSFCWLLLSLHFFQTRLFGYMMTQEVYLELQPREESL